MFEKGDEDGGSRVLLGWESFDLHLISSLPAKKSKVILAWRANMRGATPSHRLVVLTKGEESSVRKSNFLLKVFTRSFSPIVVE